MQKVKPNPGGRCGDLRRDPQLWLYGEPSPSPSVVAASSHNREEYEDDDEHPQQRTHGDASHQRQNDENDEQNDDQIHAYDPISESRPRHPWKPLREQSLSLI